MGDFSSALLKLEFDKIVHHITKLTSTDLGKAASSSIVPGTDAASIRTSLARVSEMKELLVTEGSLPLDGLKDIRTTLNKCSVENRVLTPLELLDVAAALHVSGTLSAFLRKRKELIPSVYEIAGNLFSDRVVEFNIHDAIDENGRVRDSSSKELRLIRQDMSALGEQLRKTLESIVRSVAEKDLLQEEIITTRDGRFVIPVKAEYKHRVPGFIHSASASGATVFIEPAQSLELNNTLRELQFREQREIDRILRALTLQVAAIYAALRETLSLLGELDLLAAKARYSIEILGNAPLIVDTPTVNLIDVRHPLLLQSHRRNEVVPLDLRLSHPTNSLLITGPNAGGKSVALKTVGLCALCMQAGLHIPGSPDSELSVFENIFVDIGDDQSVENDLSTFSSHLMNMKTLLAAADRHSLVLIDEIGSGTDPSEGSALASAVLAELLHRQCLTIATTHHGLLKAFAHQSEGMENGSMEFDQQTLRPTYRFRAGIPGSSYALELAERIGLRRDVLDKARTFLGSDKWKLESLIAQLNEDIRTYQNEHRALSAQREKLNSLVTDYEGRIADVKSEINELKRKAKSDTKEIVDRAQASIEQLVKRIRETSADKASIHATRDTLRDIRNDVERMLPAETAAPDTPFRLGDLVRLRDGTETGEIVELKSSNAVVLWKSGRIKVHINDLQKATKRKSPLDHANRGFPSPDARNELDLRGMTGEEAIGQIERFIDDAIVAGLHRVDIIHGKGTGALRKHVSAFLKNNPSIRSFHLGEWNEGGSGVTVVELAD